MIKNNEYNAHDRLEQHFNELRLTEEQANISVILYINGGNLDKARDSELLKDYVNCEDIDIFEIVDFDNKKYLKYLDKIINNGLLDLAVKVLLECDILIDYVALIILRRYVFSKLSLEQVLTIAKNHKLKYIKLPQALLFKEYVKNKSFKRSY